LCIVCNVVGLWKQSGDTSVTSASVPFTPPVESLSHPFPVTAVSTSDADLHSVASLQERFDNSFAVSYFSSYLGLGHFG